jgi:hypothetical protein
MLLMVAVTAAFLIQIPGRLLAATAEDVQRGMQLLKSKAAALGAPSVKGESQVAGKTVPVLYFGEAQINNNFTLVDEIKPQMGMGGTATFFVKSGDEFVRVSTNVKKADGSRAIGTILTLERNWPAGPRRPGRRPAVHDSIVEPVQGPGWHQAAAATGVISMANPRFWSGLTSRSICLPLPRLSK